MTHFWKGALCDCGHNHEEEEDAARLSLYRFIDLEHVRALNETDDSDPKGIFKPFDDRLSEEKFLQSDADEQLIIHIPFTGSVKIKSIAVYSAYGEESPSTMKAYCNQPELDFDTIEPLTPSQEFELAVQETKDHIEYPTKLTRFTNVRHLTLFFSQNNGAETTKIFYIGLKGDFSPLIKDPIVTVYELNANPADHKLPNEETLGNSIS